MEENCGNCRFKKVMPDNYVRCRRFPTGIRKSKGDWCGEWKLENKSSETGTEVKKGKRADPKPEAIPEKPKAE